MTGWRAVHAVMEAARLGGPHALPKGLRSASKWPPSPPASRSTCCRNGHARRSTTAIYVGAKATDIARRMWGIRESGVA
jgi:integrase/recombinase XerD